MQFGQTPERRPTFLIALALLLALPPSAAAVQQADPQLSASRRHPAAVLKALRDKDLAAALQRLGEAADLSPSINPSANDGLSAAAGGLHRALMQLSSDERYDLLYAWSMPSEARPQVRILTTLVPQEAPPREFARALGERPRDTSFQVSEIGGIRGLFSTGWILVQAADDVGRLRRLTSELERLAEQKIPNADVLLTLARLADRRGDTSAAADALQRRKAALEGRGAAPADPSSPIDSSDLVLAAAALQHEELRPLSEDMFKFLAETALTKRSPRLRPFLRIAHAVAAQRTHGESGPEVLYANRLKYWVPTSGKTAELSAAGGVGAMWLVHEDHILHLAGSGNDVLFLRYPLTGEFDFTCETQVGGEIGTDGGLVYGGLHFEALGRPEVLTVWDADFAYQVRRPCPFVRQEDRPTFNRVSIRSAEDGPVFAANLHPMWFDGAASQASPWLGLRSFGDRRPIFRNLKITGDPVIPREVRMSDGDEFRGWQAGFFNEILPPLTGGRRSSGPVFPVQPVGAPREPDWTVQGGVIQASKRDLPQSATAQSLLRYQRPLLDGESVSYEFHYQPGEFEVHPALGRLAFLIEPGGVRIHWITDDDLEWTGLPPDNATLEPLNRRGPRPLPLRENDWNKVTLARADGKATVSLNGELIYTRSVDFGGDLTFGLYRDAAASAVRVRNVVMSGDWPESLPKELLQNPAAVAGEPPSTADRHARNDAVGEEHLAENVRRIRREAARLAPAERFDFLSRWVLPGPDHHDFRVAGEFTQTDPSPLALHLEQGRPGGGAELVSPVFDLLDVAAETGRLEELHERIAHVPEPDDELNGRAKAALLALVSLELGRPEAAEPAFKTLQSLVSQAKPAGLYDQWPETLVGYRGIMRFSDHAAIGELLAHLYSQRTLRGRPSGIEAWHTHVVSLMKRHWHLQLGGTHASFEAGSSLTDWIPVVRTRASSRGDGCAYARWLQRGDEAHHVTGHQEEYLFYHIPLRGDFEVVADVGGFGTTQFFAAGGFFGAKYETDKLETGTFRRGGMVQPIAPPFSRTDRWVRCRADFRDNVARFFVNGRLVGEKPLEGQADPWIGVRSWWRNDARFRNVQIVGSPEIPDAVLMSASGDLTGWLGYFDDTVGYDGADWQWIDDPHGGQILGRRREGLQGTFCERLLRYHRPLIGGGTVEYEFFYEPGEAAAHAALDRLALVLDPRGVRIHWITDGKYDRTEVPPDNLVDEPHSRRGPRELPLRPGAWNDVAVSVAGDAVTLALNGQTVFQRELEPGNQRTFGVFHYAGDTEARVRNVVMRGDWPRTVPPGFEGELSDTEVASLNSALPDLQAVFTHDFAADGLPDEFFELRAKDPNARVSRTSDGFQTAVSFGGSWSQVAIVPRFVLHGDFDIEASFDRLDVNDKEAAIHLAAYFRDAQSHQARMVRGHDGHHGQYLKGQLSIGYPDGTRRYTDSFATDEATSGHLRIARRGSQIYSLFAEGDSAAFRLVGEQSASAGTIVAVHLIAVANAVGNASVVWKDVTLRAEQMTPR